MSEKSINLESLTASQFADYYGLSDLDKTVLNKKYSEVKKSEQGWIAELEDKIHLKKVLLVKEAKFKEDFLSGNFFHKGLPINNQSKQIFDKEMNLSSEVLSKRVTKKVKDNKEAKEKSTEK